MFEGLLTCHSGFVDDFVHLNDVGLHDKMSECLLSFLTTDRLTSWVILCSSNSLEHRSSIPSLRSEAPMVTTFAANLRRSSARSWTTKTSAMLPVARL